MAEKKATTKATAKKATAKKPTTKKLSVTLDAETYALLEEYIAEFGFTKDGFVKKAILEKISRDKISNMIDDMIQLKKNSHASNETLMRGIFLTISIFSDFSYFFVCMISITFISRVSSASWLSFARFFAVSSAFVLLIPSETPMTLPSIAYIAA